MMGQGKPPKALRAKGVGKEEEEDDDEGTFDTVYAKCSSAQTKRMKL
jgi:hypothetical protein